MFALVMRYHRSNWWKLWPRIGYVKLETMRVLEFLIGRYGLQFGWSAKERSPFVWHGFRRYVSEPGDKDYEGC
jgi:hypothetical protein